MNIFLDSLKIPIIFLDDDLCVVRFTDSAKEVVNLIPGDIGRPLKHITGTLDDIDLVSYARNVQQSMKYLEKEVKASNGKWYLMRILPYRIDDPKGQGVVLNFVDITDMKELAQKLEKTFKAQKYADSIIETVYIPLVVLDENFMVVSANTAFYQWFRAIKAETIGKSFYELGRGQWDIPELKEMLAKVLPEMNVIEDYKVDVEFPRVGNKKLLLNARRLMHDETYKNILISIQEVC